MLTQNWFHNLYIFPLTGKLAPLTRLNIIQKNMLLCNVLYITSVCTHFTKSMAKIMVADVNSFTYIFPTYSQ